MKARWSAVEKASLAVLAAAVMVRLVQAWTYRGHLVWDVAWYATMGRSLLATGEFFDPATGSFTHHYPPLWPILLAVGTALAGDAIAVSKVLGLLTGLGMVATVGGLTCHLYGRQAGLLAAAVFAALPALMHYDALGYPESLLVALYAVTLWAIVMSLRRPHFILLAGLTAGLAYLTKASVGPFFLLAAMGGLAWRLHHRRLAVLRDHWYLAAGAIFASMVLAWTWRNVSRFGLGGWETQPYATESLKAAFAQPDWFFVLLLKLLFATLLLAAFTMPWWGRLRRPVREVLRDEEASALWLAAVMPALIAVFFMLAFKYAEGRPTWDPDDARYLLVCLVPLLWLALDPRRKPEEDENDAAAAADRTGLVVAGLVGVALFLLLAGDVRAESQGQRNGMGMAIAAIVPLLLGGLALGWRQQTVEVAKRSAPERAIALLVEPGLAQRVILASALVFVSVSGAMSLLFPLAVAAGGALLFRSRAMRAVAFAGIVLGAGLAGATLTTPWSETARHFDALQEGQTVAAPGRQLHFAAAALDGVPLVPVEKMDNDTRYVIVPTPRVRNVEGFQLVGAHSFEVTMLPGTQLRRSLQDAFGFDASPIRPTVALAVFERTSLAATTNATG